MKKSLLFLVGMLLVSGCDLISGMTGNKSGSEIVSDGAMGGLKKNSARFNDADRFGTPENTAKEDTPSIADKPEVKDNNHRIDDKPVLEKKTPDVVAKTEKTVDETPGDVEKPEEIIRLSRRNAPKDLEFVEIKTKVVDDLKEDVLEDGVTQIGCYLNGNGEPFYTVYTDKPINDMFNLEKIRELICLDDSSMFMWSNSHLDSDRTFNVKCTDIRKTITVEKNPKVKYEPVKNGQSVEYRFMCPERMIPDYTDPGSGVNQGPMKCVIHNGLSKDEFGHFPHFGSTRCVVILNEDLPFSLEALLPWAKENFCHSTVGDNDNIVVMCYLRMDYPFMEKGSYKRVYYFNADPQFLYMKVNCDDESSNTQNKEDMK